MPPYYILPPLNGNWKNSLLNNSWVNDRGGGGGVECRNNKKALQRYHRLQLKQKEKFFRFKWIYLETRKTENIDPNRKKA